MIKPLDRKLLRDLSHMKGQMVAVSLVMACGLTMMIMSRSLIRTLEGTRDAYYQQHRMADVFGSLKRAPLYQAERLANLPGVAAVEPRVVMDATLDLPGVLEPATAHIVSLPASGPQILNRLFLRTGRLPQLGERDACVISEAFALANRLQPGAELRVTIRGHQEVLKVCGIGLSPEYVFEARAGETLPDNKRFGVFWMNYKAVAIAADLDGAFNDFCMDLSPGTEAGEVIAEADRLLAPYGALGAYTRKDHASSARLDDELTVLHALSVAYPLIFLSVAAFMVNAVLARLIRLQREQIAQLKALGYSSWQVGWHFMKFTLVIVVIGTTLGVIGGRWAGGGVVGMYEQFFRFPHLDFKLDYSAFGLALIVSAGASIVGVIGVVRQAVKLPPAEAMRPEPPADFKPSFFERIGVARWFGVGLRMALRNIERKPWQAFFTVSGLTLATGLMVLPGVMADSIDHLLTYQWNDVQRQDAVVFLTEPRSSAGLHAIAQLPGVRRVEPLRSVRIRMRYGHRSRKLSVTGMPRGADLNRLLDAAGRVIELPEEGIVMSSELARVLEAKVGDTVQLEVQEGARPVREVVISGLIADFSGVASYMDIKALQRLLREGDTANGAYLTLDQRQWEKFMLKVKATPGIAITLVKKEQLAAFRKTTGQSIGILRSVYMTLAVIVAFGVVYNSARISLSERSRDLATLRVVGFTQREVAGVLLGELVLLVLVALPFGLAFGRGLAIFIFSTLRTETIRLPLVITSFTYAQAVAVVLLAAAASSLVVSRMLRKLDLVGVLKARD